MKKIYGNTVFIKHTPIKKRKKSFFNPSISALDIALFFRQLSTLIAAGVPIVQSFEILRQCQENITFKTLINGLRNEIEAGKTIANSFRHYPRYFDNFICQLVHAGEQSGTLEVMLKRIAHYKEKSIALKNQIKQALFYPTMIFVVAMIVSITMLTCVVPRFAELFQSMHGHLPLFTLIIINISSFLRENSWLSLFPLAMSLIFIYFFKTSLKLRRYLDHVILKVPFLGNLLKKMILARLSRSLATTFAAGVPIMEALNIIAQTGGNHDYTKAIVSLRGEVSAGLQLHAAMRTNPLFPTLVIQMVKVGEESGSLELC